MTRGRGREYRDMRARGVGEESARFVSPRELRACKAGRGRSSSRRLSAGTPTEFGGHLAEEQNPRLASEVSVRVFAQP